MALTPKWLGSLVLVLVLVTCFVGLSAWQVDRAEHKNDATASQEVDELIDFNEVMDAQAPMPGVLADQRVSLTGTWIPDAQVVVPGRVLDGEQGYWVVTMFAPDGAHLGEDVAADTHGKTIAIPVVRGFTADEDTAMNSRAEHGPVELQARIGPIEGPVPGNDLPAGQVHSVSTSQLINLFPDLLTYSGFLIPEKAGGAAASIGTNGLTQVPTTTTRDEGGFDLQSAGYAVEWLIFAVMALYMWYQLLRDDYVKQRLEGGSQGSTGRTEYVVIKEAGQPRIDPEVLAGLTGLPVHRHGGPKPGRHRRGDADDPSATTTMGESTAAGHPDTARTENVTTAGTEHPTTTGAKTTENTQTGGQRK